MPYIFHSTSSPSSYSHFYVGSIYDDIRLHVARSYTSSADSPFSLISSFTVSNHLLLGLPLFLLPFTFFFHRPPSYVVFLSSHHMPIPLQSSFLYFLCDFPHFRCSSYYFISDLVQLRNSAISNLFHYFGYIVGYWHCASVITYIQMNVMQDLFIWEQPGSRPHDKHIDMGTRKRGFVPNVYWKRFSTGQALVPNREHMPLNGPYYDQWFTGSKLAWQLVWRVQSRMLACGDSQMITLQKIITMTF